MRFRQALVGAAILLLPLLLSVAGATAVKNWLVQAFEVPSASMEPTLTPGDHIFVSKLHGRRAERGEVIVFRLEDPAGPYFVKRVIAVPGDCLRIEEGRVLVNGHTLPEPYLKSSWTPGYHGTEIVPPDSYFVMGDNRADSIDSRSRGFIPASAIVGKAGLIYWSSLDPSPLPSANAQASGSRLPLAGSVRWDRVLRPIE